MPCAHPILGWRGKGGTVTFSPASACSNSVVRVPCGQCLFCRRIRSLAWATRIICEASEHVSNSFVTLTYSVDPGGLNVEDVQRFFKRFRKRVSEKIRYFCVGEYGSQNHRAHFHAVIFGWFPSIMDRHSVRRGLFGSKLLDETWCKGFCSVGELTPASAGYVAQYALKKQTGKDANEFYTDSETGEICKPECACMSRRPGIGYSWLQKHLEDVFPSDTVYFSKGVVKSPRYFFNKLKEINSDLFEEVKKSRIGLFDEAEYYRLVVDGVAEKVLRGRVESTENRHKEL